MQEELPKQPQSEPLSHLQQQPQQPRQASSTECLRFTYNVTPSTKQQLHSCTIPTTVHFTPLHVDNDPPVSNHADSLVCHTCGSYLNRYCQIMGDKMWVCCICGDNNVYRKHEAGEGVLGEEMYQLLRQKGGEERKQKLYLFVVDLCISQKELKSIKKCMLEFLKSKSQQKYQGVNLINRVALITYSKFVYCYQLSSQLNTVISISAQKMYDTATFLGFLGLGFDQIQKVADKCFVNVKAGLGKLEKRVKKLKAQGNTNHQNDPVHRCRARRALGQAFNIALNLCECLQTECRIISFIGGPCTYGIGMTIGTQFQQHMRSITEYQNGENVHYFEEAQKFYNSLRQKAEGKRSVIDTFIFSVQQTGLTQMYELARATGGLLVLGEQFSSQLNIFQQSFKKAYITSEDNDFLYSLTSSAIVSITCSKDIKINGLLGNCKCVDSARGKRFVSDKSIGHGQTNMWYIGSLNCYRTLTFAYQLSSPKAFDSSFFMQFKTAYKDYWGFKKTRIVTVKKHISVDGDTIDSGFDQEAAVVALARWYIYKLQFQPKTNLRQWLDKLLVKWASRFADYTKGDPESFALPQKMKFLPQFLYHFRRNPICRRTGISLDQLIYQMHTLNNETIQHSICIIQPALLSYSIQKPEPSAVKLQEEEMRNSVILLLDTYFHVIMWYGENIEYWEKQGFHKQKQYQHVKTLLEAPQDDLKYLLKSRFPYPGFYKTCSGHSKQRILKSKISPMASQVHNQNTLTDDKSVYAFMKALIQIVVK